MSVEVNAPNTASLLLQLSERVKDLPCGGVKIALAVPSYGHADTLCQKDVRVAVMVAAAYGVVWVGDASPDRMGFSAGRNKVAEEVMDDPFVDGIMWIDSDIRMRPNAIANLLTAAKEVKAEFISGAYHQRGKPFAPVFYHYNTVKDSFQSFQNYPENVVAPVEGCGFGFVYTSRACLQKIAAWKPQPKMKLHPLFAEGFTKKRGWFPDDRDNGGFGEDLSFCYQALKAGVPLWVHTGVQLGHLGEPEVITRERFLREMPVQPSPDLFVPLPKKE